MQGKITLGNLDSKRDWGYAKEYVEAMWLMLQNNIPEDFVIATNEMHTVREFLEESLKYVDIEIEWEGEGINEIGKNANNGSVIVEIDPKYFRPTEVELLIGDSSLAKEKLNWEPKVKFNELVKIMMKSDLEKLRK